MAGGRLENRRSAEIAECDADGGTARTGRGARLLGQTASLSASRMISTGAGTAVMGLLLGVVSVPRSI